jgi:hypothetical protein
VFHPSATWSTTAVKPRSAPEARKRSTRRFTEGADSFTRPAMSSSVRRPLSLFYVQLRPKLEPALAHAAG